MAVLILTSCMEAGDISNATEEELTMTCRSLASVGFDYWKIGDITMDGRTMEVAADIHTVHTGPDETRRYCEKRLDRS